MNEESLSQFSNSSGGAHDQRWTHRKPLDSHEMNDTYILIPRTKGKELGFFILAPQPCFFNFFARASSRDTKVALFFVLIFFSQVSKQR